MGYFARCFGKPGELAQKAASSSWLVASLSLAWFLLRTGAKPSRYSYPCQEMARANVAVFALPLVYWFSRRYWKCPRFRARVIRGVFLVAVGSGLVWGAAMRTRNQGPRSTSPSVQEVYGSAASRVVWVSDSRATGGYGEPWSGKASQTVVDQMMNDGIRALAGRVTVAESWTAIFQAHNGGRDYVPGEKIAVKVNFNNSSNCTGGGCPIPQVVLALLDQLVNVKGVAQENIGLYDVSRSFPSYFPPMISAAFPNVKLNPDAAGGCTVGDNVLGARFGCWLAGATYLINMPLLRTHSMAGVTLSLKNHLGSTNNPSAFHNGLLGTSPAGNSLVQLNSHPFIKDKLLLVVADALYGLNQGGPGGYPNLQSNSIFFSQDPVAVDSVMADYLESTSHDTRYTGNGRITLQAAAQAGLGNFETGCISGDCGFVYSAIDLVRCAEGCGSMIPPMPPRNLRTNP
jgi:uncharacterized protein (DUF362 family)